MKHNRNYLNFILDQLSELDGFTIRKMMGGVGFFHDGIMFGSILGGKFRLRSANCIVEDHCEGERGKYYFHEEMAFCEVPDEILNDKMKLKGLAEQAYEDSLNYCDFDVKAI
ncbi:MAG: TfoX/Sxy family protein [Lewinellaceae bacterium]|nr:TfoX/Sxy family protein [Lewinellaceae bacterium]